MTNNIFKDKIADITKLLAYGFVGVDGTYRYRTTLLEGQFELLFETDTDGVIRTELTDVFTGEPYTLHLVDGASGAFVGSVRAEYEKALHAIAESCYEKDVFKSGLARRVIAYVREKYGDEPEYLWEKFPQNAVWRRKDNRKWYGAILTVAKRKLGLEGDEIVEILDLRMEPNELIATVDNERYFSGYHMNKKHWFTVCLDGSVPFAEICDRLDKSYILAKNKKKQPKVYL